MSKSNLDQVFSFELTAHEIIKTFGANCTTGSSSPDSLIASHTPVWKYEVKNPRSGYSACIAQIEYSKENEVAIFIDYIVELQTPAGVVCLIWDEVTEQAEYALAKQQAHEAFIKVSALIGVHVGYQLTVDPV